MLNPRAMFRNEDIVHNFNQSTHCPFCYVSDVLQFHFLSMRTA